MDFFLSYSRKTAEFLHIFFCAPVLSSLLVHYDVVILNFRGSILDIQSVDGSKPGTDSPIRIENHRRANDTA